MGFLMFMARKMSLQAKVNDYNARLMEISNKEEQLANRQAAFQQMNNAVTSGVNMMGVLLGGMGGMGSQMAMGMGSSLVSQGMNGISNMNQSMLNAQQKHLDTEKQRLTTLLQKAQAELQQVEKAEESAIKSGTPKYTA